MTQLTNKQHTIDTTNITHNTIQYVDNSTSSVRKILLKELVDYSEDYMILLHEHYKTNKFTINEKRICVLQSTKHCKLWAGFLPRSNIGHKRPNHGHFHEGQQGQLWSTCII